MTRRRVDTLADGVSRPAIRLFGPLEIEDGARTLGPGDLGGTRPKQVLEILLAARGHLVPVERLAELVWGAEPPANAAGSLQTFVSVLRRRLVPDRLRARDLVVTATDRNGIATGGQEIYLDAQGRKAPVNVPKRQVEELVERDPDRVAQQVRAWMSED